MSHLKFIKFQITNYISTLFLFYPKFQKSLPIKTLLNKPILSVPQPPQITNISYECKNDIRVSWTLQSQPISFYRIFLDAVGADSTAHQTMNTTKEEVKSNIFKTFNKFSFQLLVKKLAMGQKYSLRISSVLRSRYDNSTLYESQLSKHEIFMVNSGKLLWNLTFLNKQVFKVSDILKM